MVMQYLKCAFILLLFTSLAIPAFATFNVIVKTDKVDYLPGERITMNLIFPGADDINVDNWPVLWVSFSGAVKRDTVTFNSCGESFQFQGGAGDAFYNPFGAIARGVDSKAFMSVVYRPEAIYHSIILFPANLNHCKFGENNLAQFFGTLVETPGDYAIFAALQYQKKDGSWVSPIDSTKIHIKSSQEVNNWGYVKIGVLLALLALLVDFMLNLYTKEIKKSKRWQIFFVSIFLVIFIAIAILIMLT
jgi:hypothetical protein